MSEWRKGVLSDIAIITMGQSPKGETCNNDGNGLPLLNGPTEFGLSHPIPTQFTEDPKRIAEIGDVLFCVRGSTTGRMNWANQKYAIGRGIASIRYKSNQYNSFIYHLLNYRLPYLLGIATGSTFPNVSKDHLNELPVNIPDNANMEIINSILFNLDHKINLLHQQNQTLEELAQTLFKRWFVDFEFPNENGEPYKSSGGEMMASELGEIPEGWEIIQLNELTSKISKGTTPRKSQLNNLESNIAFIKVKNLTDSGQINFSNIEFIPKEIHSNNLKRSILKQNDILFSIAGTIGRVAIVPKELDNSNCNQAVSFIRLKNIELTEYIHQWIKSDSVYTEIKASIVQGVQANVSLGILGSLSLPFPLKSTLSEWNLYISPLYNKINNSRSQIQTLTNLRDTLLPKLMNGELKIN